MRNGVTIVDPETTRIDAGVEIGQDARIEPWTVLAGSTVIGQDAVIGPHAHLRDTRIGPRTTVWASALEESTVAEDSEIGPYAHLRPGSQVGPRCRIGNFAEIKNSRIGAGSQQHHFSYLGDAQIGENVNIGAGSVTANYDGRAKHPTVIGDRASLGVDTMMVAPVTIGEGAITGRRIRRHPRRGAGQDGGRHPGSADRRSTQVARDRRGSTRPRRDGTEPAMRQVQAPPDGR